MQCFERIGECISVVHIDLVNFQITQRNGGPALPYEIGWKDTVSLNVGDEVVIKMRVAGFKANTCFNAQSRT